MNLFYILIDPLMLVSFVSSSLSKVILILATIITCLSPYDILFCHYFLFRTSSLLLLIFSVFDHWLLHPYLGPHKPSVHRTGGYYPRPYSFLSPSAQKLGGE